MAEKQNRARGLDHAFHILDHLRAANRPLRPNEIAQGIGAPKSSVYEIINLLLEKGILDYVGKDGRLFLGRKLYFLGQSYLHHFDLTKEAEDLLVHLAHTTGETSQLCMLEGHKYTVLLMKEGARPFRISSDVGETVPIPWTASGRLLLSHLSDQEILDFIAEEDFVLPNGKPLSKTTFLKQVRGAREEGFFSFDSIADSFTHCFAAPVFDEHAHCVATLCLIAPRDDAYKNHARYKTALTDAAATLTRKLTGDTQAVTREPAAAKGTTARPARASAKVVSG